MRYLLRSRHDGHGGHGRHNVVDQTWIMEEGERDDRMFIVAAGKASHRASPGRGAAVRAMDSPGAGLTLRGAAPP
jgi:hypothetical protein